MAKVTRNQKSQGQKRVKSRMDQINQKRNHSISKLTHIAIICLYNIKIKHLSPKMHILSLKPKDLFILKGKSFKR